MDLIIDNLDRETSRRPHAVACVSRSGSVTFDQLARESERCARGLRSLNIGPGTRVVMMVRPGPDFIVLVFALLKLRAVLVLVDPGLGLRSVGTCLRDARPDVFIGIPLAHVGRILGRWGKESISRCVTVGRRWFWPGVRFADLGRMGEGDGALPERGLGAEAAAIAFTSGSTGPPKGVLINNAMFAAQVELLRSQYAIEPGEVELITSPLFAVFAPSLGVTQVIPDMDFSRPGRVDPQNIIDPIREHRVTHMVGSPALLDRVSRHCAPRGIKLPTLRRIITGGAPVSARILDRSSSLISPQSEIHTPYGATEGFPLTTISSRDILAETQRATANGEGVCVGSTFQGVLLEIIRVTDDPVPRWSDDLRVARGEIGEVVAAATNVSTAYATRTEANAFAKIDMSDGRIAHRMGDLGYLDPRGRLWLCGRKSQRVVTANGTLYTDKCEGIFNEHPRVRRTALVGLGSAPAQKPVLCVELEAGTSQSESLRHEILALGEPHQDIDIRTVLFHPQFPVDVRHNSKIFRERLARWASDRV